MLINLLVESERKGPSQAGDALGRRSEPTGRTPLARMQRAPKRCACWHELARTECHMLRASAWPCVARWLQVEDGGGYCQRVHDLQTYGEVNREVADPALALHLSGELS